MEEGEEQGEEGEEGSRRLERRGSPEDGGVSTTAAAGTELHKAPLKLHQVPLKLHEAPLNHKKWVTEWTPALSRLADVSMRLKSKAAANLV
jgi:hypothetical protein